MEGDHSQLGHSQLLHCRRRLCSPAKPGRSLLLLPAAQQESHRASRAGLRAGRRGGGSGSSSHRPAHPPGRDGAVALRCRLQPSRARSRLLRGIPADGARPAFGVTSPAPPFHQDVPGSALFLPAQVFKGSTSKSARGFLSFFHMPHNGLVKSRKPLRLFSFLSFLPLLFFFEIIFSIGGN